MLSGGKTITADGVKALIAAEDRRIEVPSLAAGSVDLGAYDSLLEEVGT